MNFTVKEGNYTEMGVMQLEDQVIFTFEGEKEDTCCIVLVDRKTRETYRIEVSDTFCVGSLRSVAVSGVKPTDFYYYYEINGEKIIDPYATMIAGRENWNDKERFKNNYEILCGYSERMFDWKEDKAPELSKNELMIYKLHVRGFTKDLSSMRKSGGTFAGVKNRIEYLKNLGFTAIELMPVYEFEEMEIPVRTRLEVPDYVKWEPAEDDIIQPVEEKVSDKVNYWGYGPGNYFAVKASYASKKEKAGVEFKELVYKLHQNGMECILEMFFPEHTNHNLILNVLRFWVREYHVDGFHLLGENLPITAIIQDSLLSRTKIFYTGFDESAVRTDRQYQPLYVYKEEYMYPARKLLNHMNGEVREFLNQQRKQGMNVGYVNFITSNNGFTLADLFMYNDKHNDDNGENNRDGNLWNFSNNYGVEGPTRRKYIKSLRGLKWRNAMMMLFLAQGVPMLWSGDEICNSQKGNNNAYCQDNEIGWLNWKNEKLHKSELDFLQKLIDFRKSHPIISQKEPFHFQDYRAIGVPDLSYHGENAWMAESELDNRSVGVMYSGEYERKGAETVYIGYNFFSARMKLALPKLSYKKKWYLIADTTIEAEPFMLEPKENESQKYVTMNPQAICILVGK